MKNKVAVTSFILCLLVLFLIFPGITGCSSNDEKFGGMGLNVAQLFDPKASGSRGGLVVLDVIDKMPAKRCGMEKGDIITHINGEPAEGLLFDVLVKEKMRGPLGSTVTLTVKRASTNQKLYFTMTRVQLEYPN